MEDVVGINETGLKLFSETLLKYRDDIKLILDKYSDVMKKSNLYYKMDTTLSKRDDVNDYYQKRIQNPQSYKYSGFEASLDVSKMIPDTYMTYIYYKTGNLKVLDPVEHNIYL